MQKSKVFIRRLWNSGPNDPKGRMGGAGARGNRRLDASTCLLHFVVEHWSMLFAQHERCFQRFDLVISLRIPRGCQVRNSKEPEGISTSAHGNDIPPFFHLRFVATLGRTKSPRQSDGCSLGFVHCIATCSFASHFFRSIGFAVPRCRSQLLLLPGTLKMLPELSTNSFSNHIQIIFDSSDSNLHSCCLTPFEQLVIHHPTVAINSPGHCSSSAWERCGCDLGGAVRMAMANPSPVES